jgi:hypothetical protein
MQACQQARLLTVLILLSAARLAAAASAAALALPAAAAQQAGQAQLAEVHQAGAAVEEGNVQHFHRLLRVGALLHAVCRQAGGQAGIRRGARRQQAIKSTARPAGMAVAFVALCYPCLVPKDRPLPPPCLPCPQPPRTVVHIVEEGLHRLPGKVVWHQDAVGCAVGPARVAACAHMVAALAQHRPAGRWEGEQCSGRADDAG